MNDIFICYCKENLQVGQVQSQKGFNLDILYICITAIPPRVTEEADRMMRKLRDLQTQVDERSSDVARKESQMHMLEAEKESAIKRLRDAEGEIYWYSEIQDCYSAPIPLLLHLLNTLTPNIWLFILPSSCYTFPCKLVIRIWCKINTTNSS